MCTSLTRSTCIFILMCVSSLASKKINSLVYDSVNSVKMNECSRCKLLTDSFKHWLDKTSRGKYEGGDAAWEEAKMRSYARSEIRLVEIQEGLCSELKKHKDECYGLSEEAEQLLDKWWIEDNHNSADLYSWLCIETLKHCCPLNHFGENCTPCPQTKDNNICSGHGSCSGDGTRFGNGTCLCNKGYSGVVCEKCAPNFFSPEVGLCVQCHRACNGCSGEGPAACNSCKTSWQLESDICIDINECLVQSSCKTNQYCINNEGSFQCKSCDISCQTCAGGGPNNCTSCEQSNILWSSMCITRDQQRDMVLDASKRFGLYIGLLVIAFIIYRTSKHLAAVIVLANSIIIYYHETMSDVRSLDVLYNIPNIF